MGITLNPNQFFFNMRIDTFHRTLRTAIAFLSGALLSACGGNEPIVPDPEPNPAENYRAFSEETEHSEVKMSEETIFVKDKLSKDLDSFDAASGTITFRKSDLLDKQQIKVGDILYSTDRTEKTPDGYCLRVISIKESGGMVTYETEPESFLEAIDYLKETNVLSAGNYKPEDIHVYSIPIDESNETPDTRADISWDSEKGLEIEGEKVNFKSDGKETSFDIVVWEDKGSGDDVNGKFQVKLGIRVQHEVMNDNTESLTEVFDGNLILFAMMKIGVGVKIEIGTKFGLSTEQKKPELMTEEEKTMYERQKILEDMAKASLVGKRFRLLDVPFNYTCTKVIIDPRFVVYGEFKLDLEGKLVVETGIENGVYALNIENDWFDFKKRSYVRKVTNFQRYFRINSSISLKAEAGFGVGLNFEIPALPVKEKTYEGPSAFGIWFGLELSEEVKVEWNKDVVSGKTEIKATGEEGSLSCRASISGVIGIKKKSVSLDWTFWPKDGEPLELLTIPGWTWSFFVSTPSPYDLQSVVEGSSANLSWKVPIEGMLDETRIYVGNPTSVGMIPIWQDNYKGTSALYGPAPDGNYSWYVETVSEGLEHYPSDIYTFVIHASTLMTGAPKQEEGVISIPVEINTLNKILERGVVYSTVREEPLADVDRESHYRGEETSFEQSLSDLEPSKTYFARGYAKISYDSGSKYLYGNSVSFETGPGPSEPDDPGTLSPRINIYPDVLDFGEVTVQNSLSKTLEISNIGEADLTYRIVSPENSVFSASPTDKTTLRPGESRTVTVTFQPDVEGDVEGYFTVKSNDPRGDGGFYASGTGIEEYITMTGISLNKYEIVMGRGDYIGLNVIPHPENASEKYFRTSWSSSDPSVVTFPYDNYGNNCTIYGNGAGSAGILATVRVWDANERDYVTFTDECHVIVKVYIDRLLFDEGNDHWWPDDPYPVSMVAGESRSFKMKYEPTDATETELIWKSDDPSIATVSSTGLVTAYKPGKTIIRCMVATEVRGHIEIDWDLEVKYPSGSHEGFNGEQWD